MVWKIWGCGQFPGCSSPACRSDMYSTKENAFHYQHTKRDEASETPFENIARLCNKPLKMWNRNVVLQKSDNDMFV